MSVQSRSRRSLRVNPKSRPALWPASPGKLVLSIRDPVSDRAHRALFKLVLIGKKGATPR